MLQWFRMKTWACDDIELMQTDFLEAPIDEESVDLLVTSPPYNLGIEYKEYSDNLSYKKYLEFSQSWLEKAFELLKDDGRMCLNVPLDKNKGGNKSVAADITQAAKNAGFQYHSTVIWNEGNISRRTAWGSWMSASAPYVIAPVEVIVVLYKKEWKKTSGSKKSDIKKQEFMDWTNGLWTFSGESKKKVGHPAPYPVELPRRCIKLFSYVGDTVLDPFVGSGTTMIAAHLTKRKGIGVDVDEEYINLSIKRLTEEAKVNQGRLKFAA